MYWMFIWVITLLQSYRLNVARFLRNLLPEGRALEELINTFHLSKGNTFGLVRALGLDTPGSLVFRSPTQPLTKQRMLDWVLFNTLIFNCDAHGKNISFFVGSRGLSITPFYDLVNIKMYPEFEHDLAMALGDEFDENNVNAYQLADFSDTCQLPRSFVTNRLKYLGKKLRVAVEECHSAGINDDERAYLHQYKKMIQERCNHLLKETDGIVSIEL